MDDPGKPRVTIRSLAKQLGCSHAAASLALRNSPKVSPKRREEIKRFAEEMGYSPDPILKQLASYSRKSQSVRIKSALAWVNEWEDPQEFFRLTELRNYFDGAKAMAEKLGYSLDVFNLRELKMTKKRMGGILASRGIHGILIPPHPSTFDIPPDLWSTFSILRIGFNNPSSKRHIVCPDQFEGGRIAAHGMLKSGYKRIGYVGVRSKEERMRYHFVAAFQMNRDLIVPESDRVPPLFFESTDPEDGQREYAQWLERYGVDAVFVAHPKVGKWTKELGLTVGRDLGVAGSSITDSGFDSGVDQRPYEIGEVAVQYLVRMVESNEFGIPKIPQRLLISPTWVSGSSLKR